jgi:hypothetical protein
MESSAVAVEPRGLSEGERLLDAYVAPTKTFTDILRNAGWWGPCILSVLVSAAYGYLALTKVGVPTMVNNMIRNMPSLQEKMSDPATAAQIQKSMEHQISGGFYSGPAILIVASLLAAALFMLTANFVFGGRAEYKRLLAVFWYAYLPMIIFYLLVCVLLAANVNIDTFQVNNPAATNVGYFLLDGGYSPTLVAFASLLDIFSLWIFLLQCLGVAKVAGISFGKAAMSVGVWWVLYSLLKILPTMLFS